MAAIIYGVHDDDQNFKVRDVFCVATDEEASTTGAAATETLLDIVDGWPATLRKKFVAFVTGLDRLPLPRTEMLRLEMPFVALTKAEKRQQLGMLPQVSKDYPKRAAANQKVLQKLQN